MRIGLIFNNGGMVSPNKNPQGFKGSIWSKMSFIIPITGMQIIIPGIPNKALAAMTTVIDTNALILTF